VPAGSESDTASFVDEDAPTLTLIGDDTVNEGASASYSLMISDAPTSNLDVTVVIGHTTTDAGDLVAETRTVTIPAGSNSVNFSVANNDDVYSEVDESYSVSVTGTSGGGYDAQPANPAAINTTIVDEDTDGTPDNEPGEDAPTLTLTGDTSVNEGASASYTLTVSDAPTTDLDVTVVIGHTTTDAGDLVAETRTVTIPAGSNSVNFSVANFEDMVTEPNQIYTVSVTGTNGGGYEGLPANPAAINTTIIDDDSTPVAQDDAYSVNEDTVLNGTSVLLDNGNGVDSDADGDALTVIPAGPFATAQGGTVTVLADGTFTYQPPANYTGPDSFDYTVTDGANTDVGSVTINVVAVNDPPEAQDKTVTTTEDTTYVFQASDFDYTDVEGDTATSITIQSLEQVGSLRYDDGAGFRNVVVGDEISFSDIVAGNLIFVPFPNTSGTDYDDFTFTVNDADSGTVSGTINIDVTPINDGPIGPVTDDNPVVNRVNESATAGTETGLVGIASDPDPEDTVTYSLTDDAGGRFTIDPVTGIVTVTGAVALAAGTTYSVEITATSSDTTTSVETFDIGVVDGADDFAVVHESALATGSGQAQNAFDSNDEAGQNVTAGEGTITATGNLLTNDTGATQVNSVAGQTAVGGFITVNGANGTLVVNAATGDYTYTLTSAADNSGAGDGDSVVESFTYVSDVDTADLNITIVDDTAVSSDVVAEVTEAAVQSYQLLFTLDVSGSMDNDSGTINFTDGSVSTRMDMAEAALIALAEEYFSQSDDVVIHLVTFESSASYSGPFTDLASFTAAVEQGNVSGGTNYEAALNQAISAMDGNSDGLLDDTARETITYFVSDGQPTQGNTGNPVGASGWDTFLQDNATAGNDIQSYSVGIGTGITDTTPLDNIANVDINGDGSNEGAIIVTDLRDLEAELLSTVPASYGGSVVLSGGVSTVVFGADSGFIQSITISLDTTGDGTDDTPVTFTYNSATNEITNDGGYGTIAGDVLSLDSTTDFQYGKLLFEFNTGEYIYYAGAGVSEGDSFNFDFVAVDGDGDVESPASLTVNIVDGVPVAANDTDTLFANGSSMEGNVITGVGTDGGVALGDAFTTFASRGEGVDQAIDNAQVSEILYRGVSIDLTTDSSGSGVVANDGTTFNYTVVGGVLDLTNSDTSTLVFNVSGYYQYVPPAVPAPATPVTPPSSITESFTDNSEDNGVSASTTSGSITYNNGNGLGVSGGTWTDSADNGEDLILTFDSGLYPDGVQNITVGFGYDSGTGNALLYSTSGVLLDTVALTGANTQTFNDISGVGRIEFQTASGGDYSVREITFTQTLVNVSVAVTEDLTDGSADQGVIVVDPLAADPTAFERRADAGSGYVEVTFSTGLYPYGVTNVTLDFDDTGTSSGTAIVYGIDGAEIGSVPLSGGTLSLPSEWSNIGKIEIIPNGNDDDDDYQLSQVSFVSVALDETSGAQEPEIIEYTLTDEDGQFDKATLTLNTIFNTIVDNAGLNNIMGTSANDFISGLEGNDVISGGDGGDILEGGVGDDDLFGGSGVDNLVGGAGNDELHGGDDGDTLEGGDGDDELYGDDGEDVLLGEDGDDTLEGGASNDQLFGGKGSDSLTGDGGSDFLFGGEGDDVIFGSAGDDEITGGVGNDQLYGGSALSGDGNDTFIWNINEQGSTISPATDTVHFFDDSLNGDVLDLSDLLQNEELGVLTDYLNFTVGDFDGDTIADDTQISIDHDGGIYFQATQNIVLTDIDLTAAGTLTDQDIISNLLSNNNLVVD